MQEKIFHQKKIIARHPALRGDFNGLLPMPEKPRQGKRLSDNFVPIQVIGRFRYTVLVQVAFTGKYAEFQRQMERYWCLRWLRQENVQTIDATVRRENLVKLDSLPLLQRVPSVPELKPGQRVRLSVEAVDFLTLELNCRYLETLELVAVEVGVEQDESEGTVD